MTATSRKRVWRAGVRFGCPEWELLLRDDEEHAEKLPSACPGCQGDLHLVGRGEQLVEFAKWYRCEACGGLFMRRRGEIVPTKPQTGFTNFA